MWSFAGNLGDPLCYGALVNPAFRQRKTNIFLGGMCGNSARF